MPQTNTCRSISSSVQNNNIPHYCIFRKTDGDIIAVPLPTADTLKEYYVRDCDKTYVLPCFIASGEIKHHRITMNPTQMLHLV